MSTDEEQLSLYTVWSNFIYEIVGLYSIAIAFSFKKFDFAIFFMFGVIVIITGIISIVYHLRSPSYTNEPNSVNNSTYQILMEVDKGFAITTGIYALLLFFYRIVYTFEKSPDFFQYKLFKDPNFWFSLLFIILSGVFYFLGTHSYNIATKQCIEEKQQDKIMSCFTNHTNTYDIFHSNWHIFTSISGLFWLNMLRNSYNYSY